MNYERAQFKWNNTKPIRGRSTDVRPIGQRRRTHECIEREAIDEGLYAYHAVMYGTKCVTWYPNGDIVLRTGGWHTPSTAEFIHQFSPFTCFKQHNKLWVHVRTSGEHPSESVKAFPIGDSLRLNSVGNNMYLPAERVVISKQVVNRAKAKAAREPVQPFLRWAKAFLKLSDGWVMHETRKQTLGWEPLSSGAMSMPHQRTAERDMYKLLTEQADIEPEHVYLRVLCSLAVKLSDQDRLAEVHTFDGMYAGNQHTFTQRFSDYQLRYESLRDTVYRWVAKVEDIHDIVEVEPGKRPISGSV